MKIIGRQKDGWIAEFSDREMAILIGEAHLSVGGCLHQLATSGDWKTGFYHNDKPTELVGATLDIVERYRRVTSIEAEHKTLGERAAQLRMLADQLQRLAITPLVPPKETT